MIKTIKFIVGFIALFCMKFNCLSAILKYWLRDLDLNQGPSGYEPDELPGKLLNFCKKFLTLKFRAKFGANSKNTTVRPKYVAIIIVDLYSLRT